MEEARLPTLTADVVVVVVGVVVGVVIVVVVVSVIKLASFCCNCNYFKELKQKSFHKCFLVAPGHKRI